MRPYNDLTPTGQARRLRRLAISALEQFDLGAYKLKLIKHLNNTTYRLQCEDGDYLVRVHGGERDVTRIESEVRWLQAIAADTDLIVQAPRSTPSGELVVVAEVPGTADARPVTVLTWIPGRVLPQSSRSRKHFATIGRMMATLHVHATTWAPPDDFQRLTCDAESHMGPDAERALCRLGTALPVHIRRDLETTYTRVREAEERIGRSQQCFGLINRDLSFSNVLFHRGKANPIDFDEGGFGFFLFDMAVTLAGPWGTDDFFGKSEALLSGYREIRPLSVELTGHLPAFMGLRAASLILWAATQSPQHPWIEAQWESRLRQYLEVVDFAR